MFFINNFKNRILLSEHIEVNPGPKWSCNILSLEFKQTRCSWFYQSTINIGFTTTSSFDIVYLPETFLDSTIPDDDVNIQINGYLLLRAAHLNNIKRGGVSKEPLPLIRRNCLITQINVNNKKCFFKCLYRSPSQNHDQLEHFCTNYDLLL